MVDDLGAVVSDITATLNRGIDIGEDTIKRSAFVQDASIGPSQRNGSATGQRCGSFNSQIGKGSKACGIDVACVVNRTVQR